MKILVAVPYYHPEVGGLEGYARALVRAMQADADVTFVIVTSGEGPRRIEQDSVDGVPVYRLKRTITFSNTPFGWRWYFDFRAVVRSEDPDIVHAHSPVPGMADIASLAAGGRPYVLTYHASTLQKPGSALFRSAEIAYRTAERLLWRRADVLCPVSGSVLAAFPASVRSKAFPVYNAIDAELLRDRDGGKGQRVIFIASLARSHRWKGLDDTLRAISLLLSQGCGGVHLVVVGSGDDEHRYRGLTKSLGLSEHVTFAGRLEGEAKFAELRQADALISYPTSDNDALPTVVLEAWASYVPVIVSEAAAMRALVRNGVDGILVPVDQPEELAKALLNFFRMAPERRRRLAEGGAERIRSEFNWDVQADRMRSAYRVAERRHRKRTLRVRFRRNSLQT